MCRRSICLVSLALALVFILTSATHAENTGFWKFDEVSGTNAVDSSGKGHNGTLMAEANFGAASVEGAIGNALVLKDNQYVQINGYKGVLGTQARTVSAWIKAKVKKSSDQ